MTASLAAIFVCLFCAFYFMTVTYSLMTFWITTMLALLYGLLGEFSFGVLLLRIEETAIGAVIGVTVAILVLPTNTRTAIRDDTRAFLTSLSALIEISTETMFGRDETASPTEQARELDRNLQQFRVTAKPIVAGVAVLPADAAFDVAYGCSPRAIVTGEPGARAEQYRIPSGQNRSRMRSRRPQRRRTATSMRWSPSSTVQSGCTSTRPPTNSTPPRPSPATSTAGPNRS